MQCNAARLSKWVGHGACAAYVLSRGKRCNCAFEMGRVPANANLDGPISGHGVDFAVQGWLLEGVGTTLPGQGLRAKRTL